MLASFTDEEIGELDDGDETIDGNKSIEHYDAMMDQFLSTQHEKRPMTLLEARMLEKAQGIGGENGGISIDDKEVILARLHVTKTKDSENEVIDRCAQSHTFI